MLRRKPVHGLRADRRILFLAVLGLVMGTVLDAFHVHNKTALYEHVARIPYLDVAWYVPFEFATAGVVVGMFRPTFDEEFHRKRSDLAFAMVLTGVLCLAVAWYGSGYLTLNGASSHKIAAVLSVFVVLCWLGLDRTWQGAFAAAVTGGIGVVVEAALAWGGTYKYIHPDFWGVPCWLPMLYGVACLAVGNLGRFLKYSWDVHLRTDLPAAQRAA